MTTFPDFLLKSGISLLVFYLFYLMFLKKDTWYDRNRWFLLFAVAFSLVQPLVHIPLSPRTPEIIRSFTLPEVIISPSGAIAGKSVSLHPFLVIYLSGVMFFFGILIFRSAQIIHLIFRFPVKKHGMYKLVCIPESWSAFSFFKWIFIPGDPNTPGNRKIISHETIHIQNNHSLDLLLMELLCVFQWFNPAAWLLKFAMKELHEYSVDDRVLSLGTNRLDYQNLILNQVFGIEFFPLGNHFNKSLIKKRLIMMTKNKSRKISHFKLLVILPVSFALLFSLSFTITDKAQQNEFPNETNATSSIQKDSTINKEPTFLIVEEMPKFNGKGQDEFRLWLAENIHYPEIAAKNKITGKVFVNFVVETDGSVSNVKVVRGVDPALDAEAVRVVKSSPKWTPGKQRGRAVRVSFTFPINFVLK